MWSVPLQMVQVASLDGPLIGAGALAGGPWPSALLCPAPVVAAGAVFFAPCDAEPLVIYSLPRVVTAGLTPLGQSSSSSWNSGKCVSIRGTGDLLDGAAYGDW